MVMGMARAGVIRMVVVMVLPVGMVIVTVLGMRMTLVRRWRVIVRMAALMRTAVVRMHAFTVFRRGRARWLQGKPKHFEFGPDLRFIDQRPVEFDANGTRG